MSNSTARFRSTLVYTGAFDQSTTTPAIGADAIYEAHHVASIDVPDLTASATVVTVPMGSIDTDATCVVIKNNTGQELLARINGGSAALTSNPNLTFASGPKTITRAAGSWITDGFRANMAAAVSDSTNNDNDTTFTLSSVTDLVLTVLETVVAAGAANGITVTSPGAPYSHRLPDGAMMVPKAAATAATADKLTSISLKLTAQQAGAGTIDVWAFGDPS